MTTAALAADQAPSAGAPPASAPARCAQNLARLGEALAEYRRETGDWPGDLDALWPRYLPDPAVLRCPAVPPPDSHQGTNGAPVTTYRYRMADGAAAPEALHHVAPCPRPAEETWRALMRVEARVFGAITPVVRCLEHLRQGAEALNLTLAGEVLGTDGTWKTHPRARAAALETLERDLRASPAALAEAWSLGGLERYVAEWIGWELDADERRRLPAVADALGGAAPALPEHDRATAHRLRARLYRAVRQHARVEEACAAALASAAGAGDLAVTAMLHEARFRRHRRGSAAPPRDVLEHVVRAWMAEHRVPGLSLGVARGARTELTAGWGHANLELSVPAGPETVYQIGSITKQFTAAAVLLLRDEGKLALDDPITAHLPEPPAAWSGITVRHLLTHTSGIKSYTSLPDYRAKVRVDHTPEEMVARVRDEPLDFAPGERFLYNNTGYFLLGLLIERASGVPYADFVRRRIFDPVGMPSTRLNAWPDLIPHRAAGYSLRDGALRNADYYSTTQPFSAGILVSNVSDLLAWNAALEEGRVLSRRLVEEMWTPGRLNDGSEIPYGFGFRVETLLGRRKVSHGGGIPGFSTFAGRDRDAGLTIVVLTNLDSCAPGLLTLDLASFYLPEPAPRERAARTARRAAAWVGRAGRTRPTVRKAQPA